LYNGTSIHEPFRPDGAPQILPTAVPRGILGEIPELESKLAIDRLREQWVVADRRSPRDGPPAAGEADETEACLLF
jgi:hypothetical protein